MNDTRINSPAAETFQRSSPGNAGDGARTGSFKSADVRITDQASLIQSATQNAAEEMTVLLQEKTEKDIKDRDVEAGRKKESLEKIMQVPEIEDMLRTLGDLDKRDLHRGLKALINSQSRDPEVLREKARGDFEEPSHQYAALKCLVEALKARGAPAEQIAAAEAALDGLMTDSGDQIRAALNIGATAQGYAKADLGSISDLRDAYRTNIIDYKAAADVLNDLIKRFGEADLEKSIGFMLKALASDLESGGSSIDKNQLGLIMSDMNRLKTLTTVLSNCAFLMRNAKAHGANPKFTPTALLREIAPLQDAPRVQKDQIGRIPEKAGLNEIEGQIRFINDLREVVRLIPVESFQKPENRGKLLDAINDALVEKGDLELEMEVDEDDEA